MADIVITATKGGETSNAYATKAEADSYLNLLYGGQEWALLSNDDKARLLITATKTIDRMPIIYAKNSTTQALSFPIANTSLNAATEGDGFTEAREACILQAFYLFINSDAISEALRGAIQGVKSEGLSSMTKSVSGFNPFRKYGPDVLKVITLFVDFSIITNRY